MIRNLHERTILLRDKRSLYVTEYPDDVARLRQVLNDHGYEASDESIARAWGQFSDHFCASWMTLSGVSDKGLFESIWRYLEPVEGNGS